jgi:putative alpha-1,2-mannosidase
VEVTVAISGVDIAGARRNLEREAAGLSFDAARSRATDAWRAALGKIAVRGGTPAQHRTFHTAVYHAMIAPNVWSDVDGRYRGRDGQIHQATGRDQYTVFSLWDTFRALHPLLTILEPRRTEEFVATFIAQHEQGGALPVW